MAFTCNQGWENFNVGDHGDETLSGCTFNGDTDEAYIVDTPVHSGNRSLRCQIWGVGESQTIMEFQLPENTTEGNELWGRYYLYLESGWDWTSNPITKVFRFAYSGGSYISILAAKPSNYGCMWYEWEENPPEDVPGYIVGGSEYYESQLSYPENVYYLCQNRNWPPYNYLTATGVWHCLELYAKAGSSNNGAMRIWHNGELIWEKSNVSTIAEGQYIGGNGYNHFWGWWNGGAPQDQFAYIDDVVLTNVQPSNQDASGNYMIGPTDWNGSPGISPSRLKIKTITRLQNFRKIHPKF